MSYEREILVPKARILVIDDEIDIRHTLQSLLTHEGYTVATAANDTEALAQIIRDDFEVLIVDLQLRGGASGAEILRHIATYQPGAAVVALDDGHSAQPSVGSPAPRYNPISFTTNPHWIVSRVIAELNQRALVR
jgi:DNA-binding NtrC family response regulator